MRSRYAGLQPTSCSFQLRLKSQERRDFYYPNHSTPVKDDLFHRVLCSLRSSPSRSIDPLASRRSRTSHPIPSHQGSRSHQAWCRLLRTAFLNPRIPFDNRGCCHPSGSWSVPTCSIYLHRSSGPGLEEGMSCSHSPIIIRLTHPAGRRCGSRQRLIHLPPTLGFRSRHRR